MSSKEIIELVAKRMWGGGPDANVKWENIGDDCQQEFIAMAKAGIDEYRKHWVCRTDNDS